MKRVTEVVEITYKMFDIGEMVVANSSRCILEMGREYEVVRCRSPLIPYATDSIIFVVGLDHGINTEYVSPAKSPPPCEPSIAHGVSLHLSITAEAPSEDELWDAYRTDPVKWIEHLIRGDWSVEYIDIEEV